MSAARKAGGPLALAAAATALGFFAFVPTSYRGLSELGQIAGCGMIVAFLTSITLVPALIAVLNPPAEAAPDAAWPRSRRSTVFWSAIASPVVALTLGAVVLGAPLPLLAALRLQPAAPAKPESRGGRDLSRIAQGPADRRERGRDAETRSAIGRERSGASRRASRGVRGTTTLASFVPADQDAKLAAIGRAAATLAPALHPTPKAPPTDAETVAALTETATDAVAIRRQRTPAPAARRPPVSSALLTQAGRCRPGGARAGERRPSPSRCALAVGARHRAAPDAGHDRDLAGSAAAGLAGAGRRGPRAGPAEGRPRRHRGAAPFRHRRARRRARRDRPGRDALRGRQHDPARLYRSRRLRARSASSCCCGSRCAASAMSP